MQKTFFDTIKEDQILVTTNGKRFAAKNPHLNPDEDEWIAYDSDGDCYFTEDIDVEASLALMKDSQKENESDDVKTDTETDNKSDRLIFSKFHIPPEATAVQAALIYTTDDGKTWSGQIPAEITIACPEELPYLPLNGDESQIRHLAHNFIEDTWRDGFNTCREIFMTGNLSANPEHVSTDKL